MNKEKIKQQGNEASNLIEDLTLNETEADNVQGGSDPSIYRVPDITLKRGIVG